jgi:hypothetical protein
VIGLGGGELSLYVPKTPAEKSQTPRPEEQGVLSRVDSSIGQYGVPPAIAVALRDPLNYVSFDLDE